MDAEVPELQLLTIPEVFVYKIPPLQGSSGHRAADWNLEKPALTGRLRVIGKGGKVIIQVLQVPEDSSKLPQLFVSCPIKLDPDTKKPSSRLEHFVEAVQDSSRYFVLRAEDERTKRHAYIGIGFQERQSAFDLRAALDDELKRISRGDDFDDEENEELPPPAAPAVDRSLKDGQTIKVNIKLGKGKKTAKKKTGNVSLGGGIKPPGGGGIKPPGGAGIKPPGGASLLFTPPSSSGNDDDWGDFQS
mmetsp:Transcript_13992/g.22868  ORF Transcript_13992/g.22868 Transcript_13992/m.22868 type:complete len:246 (+) Transcript_13992:45-782(+)